MPMVVTRARPGHVATGKAEQPSEVVRACSTIIAPDCRVEQALSLNIDGQHYRCADALIADAAFAAALYDVAIVVIGRNEGERLRRCLAAIPPAACRIYVDSASTDGSVRLAREAGFAIIELSAPPFSAARARNAGLRLALQTHPTIAYVQMIDGDCELSPGWIAQARQALEEDGRLVAVFGRRRERFPMASIYNRMCDHEWDGPIGIVRACGGDTLLRARVVEAVNGYCESLIAGEEPDLCLRLRKAGWLISRISAEMTVHDIAMSRFGQWWKRSARGGHAFAALAYRHRAYADPSWLRDLGSLFLWDSVAAGAIVALLVGLADAAPLATSLGGTLALIWGAQFLRMMREQRRHGMPIGLAAKWGGLIMIQKVAQLLGVATFARCALLGRVPRGPDFEYKD